MNTTKKSPVVDLSFEQRWLLQELLSHPGTAKLRIVDGTWIFTIDDVLQTLVPQEDITELAHAGFIGVDGDTYGAMSPHTKWWPSIASQLTLVKQKELLAPEAAPDPSVLERIATALEDIAAGVLAIDAKLGRFIADVDGKDPWQSDMAGHHE